MKIEIWIHLMDRAIFSEYLSMKLRLFKWPGHYLNQDKILYTKLSHKPNHQNTIPLTIYLQFYKASNKNYYPEMIFFVFRWFKFFHIAMSAVDFQLIDDEKIDDSIKKRDFIKVYHQ